MAENRLRLVPCIAIRLAIAPSPICSRKLIGLGEEVCQAGFGIRNSEFGIAVGLRPKRRTIACQRVRKFGPAASCVDYPPTHPAPRFALRRSKQIG